MILTSIIKQLPIHMQERYQLNSTWAKWVNKFLRDQVVQNILVEVIREKGVEVENEVWITPPNDLKRVITINYYNSSTDLSYNEVDGLVRLNTAIEDSISQSSSYTLTNWTSATVDINDGDAEEDEWQSYLLVTSSDSFVIQSNTEGDSSTSTLTFDHGIVSPRSVPSDTSGYLIDKYVIIKYYASYTDVYDDSDVYEESVIGAQEIPLNNNAENMIFPFLKWEYYLSLEDESFQNKVLYWENQYMKEVMKEKKNVFTPKAGQRIIEARRASNYRTSIQGFRK